MFKDNNNFYYKIIKNKKILNKIKKKFFLKFKFKYNIKKIIKLNNYKREKIYKFIKINLIKIKYKYYKSKIGKLILLKVVNIINNTIILLDKYDNLFNYKIKNKKKFWVKKRYFFLVKKVNYNKNNNKINVFLSINHNLYLKNLLKLYIPEISKGIIKIKRIVRIPGSGGLSKIVVYSKFKKINIIGACIGIKGYRIKNILKELYDEKINIIKYSSDIYKYIKRIFLNINIINISIKNDIINLIYDKNDKSKLIGKYGNNIKLCKLLLNKYKLFFKCQ
ncbi:MAG: hypothetical protein NHG08_01005 [Candidatus Shikimatogenerans sp. JK-2022]|nr:hypothetical protein [Candidatus Shikimatogenerans bostrichidophilus]